jgi:hypothetical protein
MMPSAAVGSSKQSAGTEEGAGEFEEFARRLLKSVAPILPDDVTGM